MTPLDFDKENEGASSNGLSHADSPVRRLVYAEVGKHLIPEPLQLDRFISNRPKMNLPLQITPRTKRIGKEFGLIDDRVLNFKDENTDICASASTNIAVANLTNTFHLLRKNASSLFASIPPAKPTSVTENLLKRRQCLVVLDSPNIQPHFDAYPISWSRQNLIAVACGKDVYYQNLNTKAVAHLCRNLWSRSSIWCIEWAGSKRETYLASGIEDGYLQIWDATRSATEINSNGGIPKFSGNMVHTYHISEEAKVTTCAWDNDGDVLAVGSKDKRVSLVDVRVEHVVGILGTHKDKVLGMRWSADGNFLASSDYGGNVYIWDWRAGKTLAELSGTHSSRRVHKAPVKVPYSSFLNTYSCIHCLVDFRR
jgi:cell division cycle protein 20 (cofactor of APC complex)